MKIGDKVIIVNTNHYLFPNYWCFTKYWATQYDDKFHMGACVEDNTIGVIVAKHKPDTKIGGVKWLYLIETHNRVVVVGDKGFKKYNGFDIMQELNFGLDDILIFDIYNDDNIIIGQRAEAFIKGYEINKELNKIIIYTANDHILLEGDTLIKECNDGTKYKLTEVFRRYGDIYKKIFGNI